MLRKKSKPTSNLDQCFRSKKTTVLVMDDTDHFRSFPLDDSDFTLDKFFVVIDRRVYVLKYDVSKLKTYRHKSAPPVNHLLYFRDSTSMPVDVTNLMLQYPQLGLILNNLIKDMSIITLNDILAALPKDASPAEIASVSDAYHELDFVSGVMINPIDTSSQYINERIYKNPQAIASSLTSIKNLEMEWRKISNPIQKGFDKWWLVLLIIGAVAGIGIIGYVVSDSQPSQEDLYNAIQRLDEADGDGSSLTPAQELFGEEVQSELIDLDNQVGAIPDDDISVEDSVFDTVNDIVNESLANSILSAPDVRSSFEHSWQECRIVDGVQECKGILDPMLTADEDTG